MPAVRVADRAELITVLPTAVFLVAGAESWHRVLLAGQLSGRLTGFPDADLADLTAGSINALTREHPRSLGAASSVGILRWTGDTVSVLVLGDCPVVVFTDRGPEPLTQPDLLAAADPDVAYEARQGKWPRSAVHAALLADGHAPNWSATLDGDVGDLTALATVTF